MGALVAGMMTNYVTAFIDQKAVEGFSDVFMFHNRAGQYVFSVYDPVTGNPTPEENMYLCVGKPKPGAAAGIMPRRGEIREIVGVPCAAVSYDVRNSNNEIFQKLEEAFQAIQEWKASNIAGGSQ